MKNSITLLIITLFTLGFIAFFYNEVTKDTSFFVSAEHSEMSGLTQVAESNKLANEKAINSQSKQTTQAQLDDSLQEFNYGECYNLSNQEVETKRTEERQQYLQSLSDSANQDEQLAYTLFSNIVPDDSSTSLEDKRHKIDALIDLGQAKQPLVALETLRVCSIHSEYERCNNALIEQITNLHKDDIATWLHALRYYIKTGQDELAFNAVDQAKQSKYASSFYQLTATVYAQAMEDAGIGHYISNVMNSIGLYAAKTIPYNLETMWCKNNANREKYAQACIDFTTVMEQESKDTIEKMIGIQIRNIIYEKEGNTELIKLSQQRQKALSPTYLSDEGRVRINVLHTIFQYEKLLRTFLANVAALGESGAQESMQAEVMAFWASKQYVDCGGL